LEVIEAIMKQLRWIALNVVMLAGCAGIIGTRDRTPTGPPITVNPTPQQLVTWVNVNASRIEAVEATDLSMEIKAGTQSGGLSGTLHCEKPNSFRLRAKAVGKPVADFGSNEQEFWYWISQDNPPYLYHCNYTDLARGNVPLPFPFQPDWVLECLGMATLNSPPDNYQVERKGRAFELSERSVSATGRPVTKITVFHDSNVTGDTPQIKEHRLLDERGQVIATAEVKSVRRDAGSTVPQHLVIKWPQQKLEMELILKGMKVYGTPVLAQRAPDLFRRPALRDVANFDLARGTTDGLQRTGGN
jgi:hypothetical protein